MKRCSQGPIVLALGASSTAWIIRGSLPIPQGSLPALVVSLALLAGGFVALSSSATVEWLRRIIARPLKLTMGIPLLLLVPYVMGSLASHHFSPWATAGLVAYIELPCILLLPDRKRTVYGTNWREYAAMLTLALPVLVGWTGAIWTGSVQNALFRPLTSVCVGVYAFVVVRRLEQVGYHLLLQKDDIILGTLHFVLFAVLAIPLGYALHFIRFRPLAYAPQVFAVRFVWTYLLIATPEEIFFRGILQNCVEQSLRTNRRGLYALMIASAVFGASHLRHPPVPNWRYAILATLAGLFYGNVFRSRRRTSASALTHALVDTIWSMWF
jgi:uncharacterized protein